MRIEILELVHFGKFHHKRIELSPATNLIQGGNEAGKSTIYYFIYGMLFGLRPARGRARGGETDLYQRFYPWETPAAYEGVLYFTHEKRRYRLYRNFDKEKAVCRLECMDTHSEIPLPNGRIADFICGLTEENFRNTCGVCQPECRIEVPFALSLQSQAANLAMSGSRKIDLPGAQRELQKRKKSLQKESVQAQIEQDRRQEEILAGEEVRQRQNLEALNETVSGDALALKRRLQEVTKLLEQSQHRLGELSGRSRKLSGKRKGKGRRIRYPTVTGILFLLAGIASAAAAYTGAAYLPVPVTAVFGAAGIFLLMTGACLLIGQLRRRRVSAVKALYEEEENESFHLKRERQDLIRQLQEETAHTQRLIDAQESYTQTCHRLEICREEIAALQEKERQLQQDIACVQAASDILTQLGTQIQESFGVQLWGRTADLMEEITGCRRQIRIGTQLQIFVDNGKEYVPLQRLSQGTVDQFYLALRLAAADLLFADAQCPLILDESFAYYDEERLRSLLAWLTGRCDGQKLLFVCGHRECDLLDEIGEDYNYVLLQAEDLSADAAYDQNRVLSPV